MTPPRAASRHPPRGAALAVRQSRPGGALGELPLRDQEPDAAEGDLPEGTAEPASTGRSGEALGELPRSTPQRLRRSCLVPGHSGTGFAGPPVPPTGKALGELPLTPTAPDAAEGDLPQGTAEPASPGRQCRPPGGVTRSGAGGRQSGAALLLAMLTVALVATLASAALWQQWRSAEVEAAERQRLQAGWILVGALDWARLILREDGRSNRNVGASDHLGEPWATPLEEARLSSFLAADRNNNAEELMPAFLSGDMMDMQSRLNFRNLVNTMGSGAEAKAALSEPDVAAFRRLFDLLNLPQAELDIASANLLRTAERSQDDPEPSVAPLVPQRFAQLRWLGLSEPTLAALQAHVTVLPERSRLNLNTASAEALSASIAGLSLGGAQQVVAIRAIGPFTSVEDALARIPGASAQTVNSQLHDVRSQFFEARVRLRLDDTLIQERSLIQRNGMSTSVRWRERVAAS